MSSLPPRPACAAPDHRADGRGGADGKISRLCCLGCRRNRAPAAASHVDDAARRRRGLRGRSPARHCGGVRLSRKRRSAARPAARARRAGAAPALLASIAGARRYREARRALRPYRQARGRDGGAAPAGVRSRARQPHLHARGRAQGLGRDGCDPGPAQRRDRRPARARRASAPKRPPPPSPSCRSASRA